MLQSSKSDSSFAPKAREAIRLFNETFYVQSHPATTATNTDLPHSSEGRRALVYQLANSKGHKFALKVFKQKYREASLETSLFHLTKLEKLEGFRAATRRVIRPSDPPARKHPNLRYAMLMPWISGKTWFDMLSRAQQFETYLDDQTAIALCARFLRVMDEVERNGLAHTDISPGNVVLNIEAGKMDVQLLDLEDCYARGLPPPPEHHRNLGARGYQHRSQAVLWCEEADRYATGVLAAEILVLADSDLASEATDEGFFGGNCDTTEGAARFKEADRWLLRIAPEFAEAFRRTWRADTLAACPSLAALHYAIGPAVSRAVRAAARSMDEGFRQQPPKKTDVVWTTNPTPPESIVTWVPWNQSPQSTEQSFEAPIETDETAQPSEPSTSPWIWVIVVALVCVFFLIWLANQ